MSVESAADSVLREILRTAVRRNRSPREYPKMAAGDTQEPRKLTAWRNRKWGCRRRESESANREIAWISTGGLLSPSCSRRLKWGAYKILKIGQQSSASHQPPCRQSEADDWTPKGLPIRQHASMQPPYSAQPGKARQVPGNFRASCAVRAPAEALPDIPSMECRHG